MPTIVQEIVRASLQESLTEKRARQADRAARRAALVRATISQELREASADFRRKIELRIDARKAAARRGELEDLFRT